MECPACSSKVSRLVSGRVYVCVGCGALFGDCYLGDSYGFVKPSFVTSEPDPERVRYYDFTCVGSAGVTRRHGWFDIDSRRIVQVG
jgi:DNA-directed RNA polymerase subunit RPC12/RpoP